MSKEPLKLVPAKKKLKTAKDMYSDLFDVIFDEEYDHITTTEVVGLLARIQHRLLSTSSITDEDG